MRIIIAAIGKSRTSPEHQLVEEYTMRANGLARQIGFSGVELIAGEAPKKLQGAARIDKESAILSAAVPQGADFIALDERGRNINTTEFTNLLARHRDDGRGALAFVIGGADGLSPQMKSKATQTLSFGAATWPHMLVRAMLCEQVYRAMTVLAGHPYHRS